MAQFSTMKARSAASRPVIGMGAAGPPPPPSDAATAWYLFLTLSALAILRIAPFATASGAPPSLLRDDDAHASLYAASAALILLAYAPAAVGLARRGGGAPALLGASVAAFVVASAPLEAVFRVAGDASATPRLLVAYAALAGWLGGLSNGPHSLVWSAVFFGAIALVDAVAADSGIRFALEFVILTGLHANLSRAPSVPRGASEGAWRACALLGALPLGVAVLLPLLLTTGHAFGHLDERPVNHGGYLYCPTRHRVVYPQTVAELEQAVRDHARVRAAGAGHSWSANACPAAGGVRVSTDLLRAVAYDNASHAVTADAGVTFGTLQTLLHARNRQLAANWHGSVTVGGAVATSVQHLSVSIASLCTSVQLVLANGSLLHVDAADPLFPYVFGAAGLLGVTARATLSTMPRAELLWDAATVPYADAATLAARVDAWAADPAMASSILWILPGETTTQLASFGPPLAPPNASAIRTPRAPHLPKHHFGDVGLTHALYANLLAIALALAEPLVRSVSDAVAETEMRAFVDTYQSLEVSRPHAPMDLEDDPDNDVVPTRLASVEVDVPLDAAHLAPCVAALTAFDYAVALHVRPAPATPVLPLATGGPACFHVDLSFSTPLLELMRDGLARAVDACPPPLRADGHPAAVAHAGKASLRELLELRIWAAPKPSALPGRSGSAAHAHFRALTAQLDPSGKFTPVQ